MDKELIQKYLIENREQKEISEGLLSKSRKKNSGSFSSLGKRLMVRYGRAQTTEEKSNVIMGLGLVILGFLTNDKGLGNRGIKISQLTKDSE